MMSSAALDKKSIGMLLAAVGDSNDLRTSSGIPWHLMQEGKRQGMFDEGLALEVESLRWTLRRYLWNLGAALQCRGVGGYQYSTSFLEQLWHPFRESVRGRAILNCFQLYPPSIVADRSVRRWYFLDQTLVQLFDGYGVAAKIGSAIRSEALEREREGYETADCIVVHSHWAEKSVVEDYGVDPGRVAVVLPGANLEHSAYSAWEAEQGSERQRSNNPLRLTFVGKDARRKGLDRLLGALRLAKERGSRCTLRVIGCEESSVEESLRHVPGVEWFGFVDKRTEPRRFLDAVSSCDVGCLLSRAEAGGISLREFHALGLAVLGPDVGGAPDHVLTEASVLVRPDATDDEIASVILMLEHDPERVLRMRTASWNRRRGVSWASTVGQLKDLMAGEKP